LGTAENAAHKTKALAKNAKEESRNLNVAYKNFKWRIPEEFNAAAASEGPQIRERNLWVVLCACVGGM
jgi:hypothetical protein